MERNAERLAAASTAVEVAAATVARSGALSGRTSCSSGASVRSRASRGARRRSGVPPDESAGSRRDPLERGGLVSEAMTGRSARRGRVGRGATTPLSRAGRNGGVGADHSSRCRWDSAGDVIGAIFAAAKRRAGSPAGGVPLLLGIAEQTGVALDRASLQADAERVAEADAFLALVGESLERETTASGRAAPRRRARRRSARRLRSASRYESDEVEEVASAGSHPEELADEDARCGGSARSSRQGVRPARTSSTRARTAGPGPSPVLVLPLRARGTVSAP